MTANIVFAVYCADFSNHSTFTNPSYFLHLVHCEVDTIVKLIKLTLMVSLISNLHTTNALIKIHILVMRHPTVETKHLFQVKVLKIPKGIKITYRLLHFILKANDFLPFLIIFITERQDVFLN